MSRTGETVTRWGWDQQGGVWGQQRAGTEAGHCQDGKTPVFFWEVNH